jgi:predicted deacylase
MKRHLCTCSTLLILLGLVGACGSNDGDERAQGGAGSSAAHGFDPADLPAITFDRYHTYAEAVGYLSGVAAVAPEVAAFQVAGQSVEGRDLAYLVLDATGLDSPPAVFLNGAHHGNEHPSAESLLACVDHLLGHLDEPSVAATLGHFALYVMPIVNPDGFEAGTRENANGVDLNRDYAGPTIAEDTAFSQVETQAMRQLIADTPFVAAAAFHAADANKEVLWPWGYTAEPTADSADLEAVAQATASAMGFDRFLQSYADYPTSGEFLDYAYFETNMLAFTIEVTAPKMPKPSALPGIVSVAVDGTLAMLQELRAREARSAHAAIAPEQHVDAQQVVAVNPSATELE